MQRKKVQYFCIKPLLFLWWEEVDIAETPKGVPSAKRRLADGHGNMAPKNNAARLARTTANTAFLSTTSFRPAKTAPEWVPFGGGKR